MTDRINKDEAKRRYASADKRVKGISNIADTAIRRAKVVELEKQYGSKAGNKAAVTSVDRALNALTKSTTALATGVKQITVETARGIKSITTTGADALGEYSAAIKEDFHIKREGLLATTTGKVTPLIGYAIAKLFETTVFKTMIQKMKNGLSAALDSVSSKFKRLASAGWDKAGEFWNSMMDKISSRRGAVQTKVKKTKSSKAKRGKGLTKRIEKQVPHMAKGGFVKKEGLAKVHAAEVVQPVSHVVEEIVEQVNNRLDAKERKQKNFLEGTVFDSTRGKAKDLFGFEKVGESLRNTMQVLFRKQLNLEGQIIRRGKEERRGLIKSFFAAYTEEAKQEELPLMERQVQATLELKKTISGERKLTAAAWEKMLYEHPVFNAIYTSAKGITKGFVAPFKIAFKRRGVYASDLTSRGTVFERLVDAMSQLYSGTMIRLDSITQNTGQAAAAAGVKGGDLIKAPTQKTGWSIIGQYMKWAWMKPLQAVIRGSSKLSQFVLRNTMGIGKSDEEWENTALGTKDFGGFAKKKISAWNKARKEKAAAKAQARRDKAAGWIKDRYGKFQEWKNISSKEEEENYKRRQAHAKLMKNVKKQQAKDARKSKLNKFKNWFLEGNEETDANAKAKNKLYKLQQYWYLLRNKIEEQKAEDYKQESIAKKREAKRKEAWDKWNAKRTRKDGKPRLQKGRKDKSGKPTVFAKLSDMLKEIKKGRIAQEKGNDIATIANKALKKAGSWIWGLVMKAGMFIMSMGGKAAGWISSALGSVVGSVVGAAALAKVGVIIGVAAAGAIGLSIAKVLSDRQALRTAEETKATLSKAEATKKEFVAGKADKDQLTKSVTLTKAQKGMSERKENSGWTTWDFLQQNQVTKDAQTAYMNANIAKYSQYTPDEITRVREKFNSGMSGFWNNKVRMKTVLENPEKYGKRRESAFLNYLLKHGDKATEEEMNKGIELDSFNKQKSSYAKHISPAIAAKIQAAQAISSDYLPIFAGFTGSTVAMLSAGFLNKYSINNPNALLKAADRIAGISKQAWTAAGGSAAVHQGAKLFSASKSKILAMWDKSAGVFTDVKDATITKAKELANTQAGKTVTAGLIKGRDAAAGAYDTADKLTGGMITSGTTGAIHMFSSFKEKAIEAGAKLPAIMATMAVNVVGALKSIGNFMSDAYGNPKQFYENMRDKVFAGISKIRDHGVHLYEKMHDIYKVLEEQLIEFKLSVKSKYDTIPSPISPVATISAGIGQGFEFKGPKSQVSSMLVHGHGGEVGFISPTDVQERLGIMGGLNSKQVAMMGARKDLFQASLTGDMINGMNGIKNSVEDSSETSAMMMANVFDSSTKMMTNSPTNVSGGGGGGGSSFRDPSIDLIMNGNIT